MAKKPRTQKPTQVPQQHSAQASPLPASIATPIRQQTEKQELKAFIEALESVRGGTRVIVYWTSDIAKISEGVAVPLYDQLCKIGKQEAIDLVLHTRGGDTEAPWRIVSLIREYCGRFSVLIPHRAHSSGTLLALGADEIIMSPLAVLGPIDPSRTHPLLPRREGATEAEPISVQDMRHAMQFIYEAAGQRMAYTPEAMAQIFAALFEKIHPLAIGAIEQSYALAKIVATRCLSTHMKESPEEIEAIVNKLRDEYKSHAYEITRGEARDIGLTAVDAPPAVETAMMDLYRFYVSRRVPPPNLPPRGQSGTLSIAWLDSAQLNMRAQADFHVQDKGRLEIVADRWEPY